MADAPKVQAMWAVYRADDGKLDDMHRTERVARRTAIARTVEMGIARTHVAGVFVPWPDNEALVEQASAALYEAQSNNRPWADLDDDVKRVYRQDARVVLTAALSPEGA